MAPMNFLRYVKVIRGTQLTFAAAEYGQLRIYDRVSQTLSISYDYAPGLGDTINLFFTFVAGRRQAFLPITGAGFAALVTFPEIPCH